MGVSADFSTTVASTIKKQIGVWPLAEVGARHFLGIKSGLRFTAKPRHRLVVVTVTLTPTDLYDVTVVQYSNGKELYAVEGVYWDSLPTVIRNLPKEV